MFQLLFQLHSQSFVFAELRHVRLCGEILHPREEAKESFMAPEYYLDSPILFQYPIKNGGIVVHRMFQMVKSLQGRSMIWPKSETQRS
jgi:hypothetical protein